MAVHDCQQITGASAMAADERSHARVLEYLTRNVRGGMSGSVIAQIEVQL